MVSQNAETGIITVVKAFADAPAAKAGVKNGDIIYKVKGKEVTGVDINNVVTEMKGEKGTTVDITVYRESEKKYIDFTITRDQVNEPTVEYKMLDKKKKIGYIQISQFEEVTYDQFTKALDDLKKQGMKAVIFDVRSNPGGLYETVCKMLDEILPEGIWFQLRINMEMRKSRLQTASALKCQWLFCRIRTAPVHQKFLQVQFRT